MIAGSAVREQSAASIGNVPNGNGKDGEGFGRAAASL